jgi:hypothetical protein
MYGLLRGYHERGLKPMPVLLGSATEPLTADEETAADFLRLAIGLRAAVCEFRPMICSCRFLARQVGWEHQMRAQRALMGLCTKGLIRTPGTMPGSRTKLYEPNVLPTEGNAAAVQQQVEPASPPIAVSVEPDDRGAVGERDPPGEHATVCHAVTGHRREVWEHDDGLVTARNGTGNDGFHSPMSIGAEKCAARQL